MIPGRYILGGKLLSFHHLPLITEIPRSPTWSTKSSMVVPYDLSAFRQNAVRKTIAPGNPMLEEALTLRYIKE